jgi:Family of unknown function (DUF6152)
MRQLVFGVVSSLALAPPVHAHHGAGLFDPNRTTTVEGTVTQFQFVNPHVLVYVRAAADDGEDVEWAGELTSPNRLAREGSANVKWHKDILKPGDRITMTGSPARNGAPAMVITKIVDASGRALIGGAP